MLRRVFSLLLACIFFCLSGATDALAVGAAELHMRQLKSIDYFDSICGSGSTAPAYRAGMGLKGANARQMETALHYMINDEVLPVLNYMEGTSVAQYVTSVSSVLPEHALLQDKCEQARLLYAEVMGYMTGIATHRGIIESELKLIEEGAYTSAMEADHAALRVLNSLNTLQRLMAEVEVRYEMTANGQNGWRQQVDELSEFIDVDNDGCRDDDDKVAAPSLEKAAQYAMVQTRAAYMDTMLEQARLKGRQEGDTDFEIDFFVLTHDMVGIELRDENNNPILNADVYMWPANDPADRHKVPCNKGNSYVFVATDFGLDTVDNTVSVGYEIICEGYRHIYAQTVRVKAGVLHCFQMTKLQSEDEVYIAGISFNKDDILWNPYFVYATPKNDARQQISVFLTKGTHSMPGNGEVTMHYWDSSEVMHHELVNYAPDQSLGMAVARLDDQWCRKLPNGPKSLAFDVGNRMQIVAEAEDTVKSQMKVREAAKEEPITETGNKTVLATLLATQMMSMGFSPDIPVLGGSSLSFGWPNPPIILYSGPDGTSMAGIHLNPDFDTFVGDHTANQVWKTESQREIDRRVEKIANESGRKMSEERAAFMASHGADYHNKWLGGVEAFWDFSGMVLTKPIYDIAGQVDHAEGSFQFIAMAGGKGAFSQTFACPVPVKLTVNVMLGFGLDVTIPFTEPYPDLFNTLGQRKFKDPDVYAIIKFSFSVSVGFSAGVGSFTIAAAGVKGALNLALMFPVVVHADGTTGELCHVIFNFSISVYVTLLNVTFDTAIGKFDLTKPQGTTKATVKGYIIFVGWLPKKSPNPDSSEPEDGVGFSVTPQLADTHREAYDINMAGKTVWNYTNHSVGDASLPVFVRLPQDWNPYQDYKVGNFLFWVENNKVMVSDDSMTNPTEFPLPEKGRTVTNLDDSGDTDHYQSTLDHIRKGEYTLYGVDLSPETVSTHVNMQGMPDPQYHTDELNIETAVLTVSYVKTWIEIEEPNPADGGLTKIKSRKPSSMGAILIPIHLAKDKTDIPSTFKLSDADGGFTERWGDAAFELVLNDDDIIDSDYDYDLFNTFNHMVAYPWNLQMAQIEAGKNDVALVVARPGQTKQGNFWVYGDFNTRDGVELWKSTFTSAGSNFNQEDPELQKKGIHDIHYYRQVEEPFFLALDEDKHLVFGSRAGWEVLSTIDGHSIVFEDMVVASDALQQHDIWGHFTVFGLEKKSGTASDAPAKNLFNVSAEIHVKSDGGVEITKKTYTDYEMELSCGKLHVGPIMGEEFCDVVYWFELCNPITQSRIDAGETAFRVRGFYCTGNRCISQDYTWAVLEGNDDNIPPETEVVTLPIDSMVIGNMLFMTRALVPKGLPVDQSYSSGEHPLIYTVAEAASHGRITVAGASIDRKTYVTGDTMKLNYTLVNDGNIPVYEVTMGIYRVPADGSPRELLASATYNPKDFELNSLTQYDANGKVSSVRTGVAAIMQETNLFERFAPDMLYYEEGAMPSDTLRIETPLGTW